MVGNKGKEIHVEHWVQAKERRNVELKRIIPHGLGDSVWSHNGVGEASDGVL
jgi:hypothetical protein